MRSTTVQLPQPGPVIRGLIIANVVAYVLFLVALRVIGADVLGLVALTPADFFDGALWQPLTSLFVHSPNSVGHLLSNMLWLWLFASEVESAKGARFTLTVYLVGGLAGAALTLLLGFASHIFTGPDGVPGMWLSQHMGASGAVMALTACWGGLFWHQVRNFLFLGPMRIRTFMFILIAIEMLVALSFENVSSTSHFAGLAVGLAYGRGLLNVGWLAGLRGRFGRERRRRETEEALRRFKVLPGGRDPRPGRNGDDEWIN